MVLTLEDVRHQLAKILAQVIAAETVLARIRAHGDPRHADKEASTRQLIEALSTQAETLALQLSGSQGRVLH